MKSLKLRDDFYWTGIIDDQLRVFDIIMYTEFGTTYNSYVMKAGDKTVLFETAKAKFFDEYLEHLQEVIDIRKIDYLVVSHTEPDHAGSVERLLDYSPQMKVIATGCALGFLKEIVNRIYAAMIRTEYMVYEMYPQIKPCLPQKLHFIHSEELRQLYPNLEPKCREHAICQKYGAVFIIGIGCKLSDGKKHDGRAPDYDDYTSTGLNNLPGLNGDLLLWDDVLQRSIELSSMGVRVDREALQRQLKEENEEERLKLYFHKRLMDDTLPLSIGGGIGQSRLCMFYLRKAHIGEIQASIWPEDMRKECEELDIHLI